MAAKPLDPVLVDYSIMYRRTFDAVTRAKTLCTKSRQRVVAPAEFEALAIEILRDDAASIMEQLANGL